MRIKITGDDFEITKETRELVEKKIATKLDSFLPTFDPDVKTATMKFSKGSRWGYKISFNMTLPKNHLIFCEEKESTIEKTLNLLRDAILKQVTKYKEKLVEHSTS